MTIQKRHQFSLYMEGIKVPFAAARVNTFVDGPATATITLPPTPSSFHAPKRTWVHLFWYDGDQPRLLFEGETIGRGISKGQAMKGATYRCRDLTMYWEHAHQLFFSQDTTLNTPLSNKEFGVFFGATAAAQDANRAPTTGRFKNKVSIGNLLTSAFEEVATLKQGFQSIFDYLGGSADGEQAPINRYWAYSEARAKLRNKIVTIDNPTALRLLRSQLDHLVSDLNITAVDTASAWELVQILISRLYYQLVCNPTPPYYRKGLDEGRIRDIDLSNPRDISRGLGNTVNYVIMPDLYLAQPPRCNVIMPPMVTDFSFTDNFVQAPTRTIALTEEVDGITYYAPKEVELTDRQAILTEEEKLRGFVPRIIHVSPDEKRNNDQMAEIVNYRHWMEVYATRQASGAGQFNPFLAVGFPCATFDRDFGIIAGSLRSVVHDIDLRGESRVQTQFMMGFCRYTSVPLDDYIPDFERSREIEVPEALYPDVDRPGVPAWFDAAFEDDKIGRSVYNPVLGYEEDQSAVREFITQGSNRTYETLRDALERLQRDHLATTDEGREAMAWNYIQRPIATQFETFLAIGAEPADAGVREQIKDRKVSNQDDWLFLQALDVDEYRNPDGTVQDFNTVNTIENQRDVRGPFISVKQGWARQYRGEANRPYGR